MSRNYGNDYSSNRGPNFRWWIPADGIRRDVITADIQRYLGSEAVVKPGEGRDADRGRSGYWIAAYRTLTPAMIQDLKADSANFVRSGDTGSPLPEGFGLHIPIDPNFSLGRYEDSMTHRSRQHWLGPTVEPAAEPSRMPSRAESDATSYASRESQSSYGSNPQYGSNPSAYGNAQPQYEYDAYGRPIQQREPEPRRQVQPQVDQYGRPYDSGPSGYAPHVQHTQSTASGEYTHLPSSSSSRFPPSQEPGYRAPAEHAQGPRGHDYGAYPVPQQQQASIANYSSGRGMPTSSASHQNVASRQQAPPPGYYLASDGNYYPESSRPT